MTEKMHRIYIFIQAMIKRKFTIIVYDVLAMLTLYSSYIRRFHIKIGTRHFPIYFNLLIEVKNIKEQ